MRTQRLVARAVMMGLLAAVPVVVAAGSRQPPAGINRVAWLRGCWETTSGQRTTEEQWMAPRAGSMLGMSRTMREGLLGEFEFVVLRERGDRLVYEAHPSGQAGAAFLSRTVSDAIVVFENPGHDLPALIGYERKGPDSLLAWIEGTASGRTRRIDFPYRRVACPGLR